MNGLITLLVVLGIMIYGLCYMVGGPRAANGFARGVNRTGQRGVRHVGRTASRAANAYPLVAGIIVIILLLMITGKC